MLSAIGTSVVGPSHAESGQPCQDACGVRGWRGGWIACVADGLGSRSQSGIGAKYAVRAAQQVLRHEREGAYMAVGRWHGLDPIPRSGACVDAVQKRLRQRDARHGHRQGLERMVNA